MENCTSRQSNAASATTPSRRPLLFALLVAVTASLLCLALAGPASADDDDDDGGEFASRQVVVKFKPGTSNAAVAAFNRKYNTRTIQRLAGGGKIYLLRTPRGVDPARLAARMRNDSRVLYAEPNFRAGAPEGSRQHRANPGGIPDTTISDATQYENQYAVDSLNLTEAHATSRGAGTVVAVIDTGVQSGHEALAGKTTAGYDFVDMDRTPDDAGDGRDNDLDGETDEMVGHGTHVAGVIALAAPEAEIMPIRALDTEGRGTTFGIAKAIRYATRNGADVVNLSLGSSRETELLEDLIGDDDDDDGGAGRAVFVAAAGNDGTDEIQCPKSGSCRQQFPAAEDGALAVASVDDQMTKSDFSNFGGWLTVAAPGTDIHAPYPQDDYAVWSGTSMATPFVAGQAALVSSVVPRADASCVAGIIETTADRAALDAANPDYFGKLGSGHADAAASTDYAANRQNPCAGTGDDD